MRYLIGTVALFAAGMVFLSMGHFFGLVTLAFGISALLYLMTPQSPFGVPGYAAAMLVGSLVLVAFLAVGIDGFFDDC